jgi:hypothetical protein
VVGAEEESLRIEAGVVKREAATNRVSPNAKNATGSKSIHCSKNVYAKPGALFSVYRLSAAEAFRS